MSDLNFDLIFGSAFGGINFSPPPVDNSKNKKLHVKFTRGGSFFPIVTEAEAQRYLAFFWNSFGTVVEAIYPSDHYGYCFVRYATHEQAQAAYDGMTNSERVAEICRTWVVTKQAYFSGVGYVPTMTDLNEFQFVQNLLINPTSKSEPACRPSWSYIKNKPKSYNDYDDF